MVCGIYWFSLLLST
uniref:Uncharacterized protein n=1 Tax=Anguilla anguilla TaxID=7936 RepID=A0A0E9SEU8_ANGAN